MSNGIFVTYWKLMHLSDGPKYCQDQVAFKGGGINEFRRVFKNPRIIGYHEINDDGEVESAAIMLNEPPPPLPGAIPVAQNKQEDSSVPPVITSAKENALETPSLPSPPQDPIKPKIVKNGNQYLKIEGDKISSLEWEQYVDSEAKFDDRIRATATGNGQILIERTVWKELSVEEN